MPPVRQVAYRRPLHGLLRATQWLRLERVPALNDGIAELRPPAPAHPISPFEFPPSRP